jgi:hypothetical protein
MTRSRAFHRFNRWTAKLRRRHLRSALPEPREGERALLKPGADLRKHGWMQDQLADLTEAELTGEYASLEAA